MAQLVYNPGVFNADTFDRARQLSSIAGTAIPENIRWGEEVKMPMLKQIFKDKSHPCWADTAWIFDATGEDPGK